MPLIQTKGNVSAQGYGWSTTLPERVYIEDVFSTWLYTGNGSTQTITNGIDLAGKGGLVWLKNRTGTYDHWLWDTSRGAGFALRSNTTAAQANIGTTEGVSFTSSGFSFGNNINWNASGTTAVSWTFREQPKFFDVVTYTGNDSSNRQIPHSLGSEPGFIVIKATNTTNNWECYHRSLGNANIIRLNTTSAAIGVDATYWNNTNPTSTAFTVGSNFNVNSSANTYVAYLFAHDAGGFGATGTDNVISCESMTIGASDTTVTLGWEPQWILVKRTTGVGGSWILLDTMRGLPVGGSAIGLFPNTSGAEQQAVNSINLTATGFVIPAGALGTGTYIYIAIRRGPMRTPTSGTSVFGLSNNTVTSGNWIPYTSNGRLSGVIGGLSTNVNPIDWALLKASSAVDDWAGTTRLAGFSSTNTAISTSLSTNTTAAESVKAGGVRGDAAAASTGLEARPIATGTVSFPLYSFARAPGFFDVVCYSGDGTYAPRNHNLGVPPEFIIQKARNVTSNWPAYTPTFTGYLNNSGAFSNFSQPTTSTTFTPQEDAVGRNIVTYLFASCPGVSKVGSYTGTGATQTINCGFSSGARFVLIKRTNSLGDWYVWDTARGIVAGNDPYLLLNSTAAEVTNTDWVDTAASGFELSNAVGNNANINGAIYIFLAIA